MAECKVCKLPADVLMKVDQRLRTGDSKTAIAKDYAISRHSITRHFVNGHHIIPDVIANVEKTGLVVPPSGERAKKEIMPVQPVDVLQAIAVVVEDIHVVQQGYKEKGNPRGVLEAAKVSKPFLELQAKIEGLIKEGQVNILVNPQWTALKGVVLRVLENYPEARQAVVDELRGMDTMRVVEGESADAEG